MFVMDFSNEWDKKVLCSSSEFFFVSEIGSKFKRGIGILKSFLVL